jgi:ATP-dependent Clp protease ATP-binding subunit ClpA
MLQTNVEIDHIVVQATELAQSLQHEYVTLEHVFLCMIRYEPFKNLLTEFGADVDGLDADLQVYLEEQTYLITTNIDPKKTHALERVFNRAFTQVLFIFGLLILSYLIKSSNEELSQVYFSLVEVDVYTIHYFKTKLLFFF